MLLVVAVTLPACGSLAEKAEAVLESAGIKMPGSAARADKPRTVSLRLEAAPDMNAGQDDQGLPTVLRLYKLRSQNAFLATPYGSFGTHESESMALGADLLEVRELVLAPGQTLNLGEKMPPEAAYLGIVAMFRSPSAQRWRFAFATTDAAASGISLGVHACAMTATRTAPAGMTLESAFLLSPAPCK